MKNFKLGFGMDGLQDYFMAVIDDGLNIARITEKRPIYHEIGLGAGQTFLVVKNYYEAKAITPNGYVIGYDRPNPEVNELFCGLIKNGIICQDRLPVDDFNHYAVFRTDNYPRKLAWQDHTSCHHTVFIDGCHCYKCAKADLNSCIALPSGSFIMLHDASAEDQHEHNKQCSGDLGVYQMLSDWDILTNKNSFFELIDSVRGARTITTVRRR